VLIALADRAPEATLDEPTPWGEARKRRLRLTFAVLPTPCGWDSYGEVEDYTIDVLPPPRR